MYPSTRAALAVRDLPALLSSGSYQLAKSNLSLGMVTEQFLPSMRTFQKLSSPSPVWKHTCTVHNYYVQLETVRRWSGEKQLLFVFYNCTFGWEMEMEMVKLWWNEQHNLSTVTSFEQNKIHNIHFRNTRDWFLWTLMMDKRLCVWWSNNVEMILFNLL